MLNSLTSPTDRFFLHQITRYYEKNEYTKCNPRLDVQGAELKKE